MWSINVMCGWRSFGLRAGGPGLGARGTGHGARSRGCDDGVRDLGRDRALDIAGPVALCRFPPTIPTPNTPPPQLGFFLLMLSKYPG